MVEEKILTISFRKKNLNKPRWKRNKISIKTLKNSLKRMMKGEKIKIDRKLNEKIWSKNSGRVRIKLIKLDDKTVKAELSE